MQTGKSKIVQVSGLCRVAKAIYGIGCGGYGKTSSHCHCDLCKEEWPELTIHLICPRAKKQAQGERMILNDILVYEKVYIKPHQR